MQSDVSARRCYGMLERIPLITHLSKRANLLQVEPFHSRVQGVESPGASSSRGLWTTSTKPCPAQRWAATCCARPTWYSGKVANTTKSNSQAWPRKSWCARKGLGNLHARHRLAFSEHSAASRVSEALKPSHVVAGHYMHDAYDKKAAAPALDDILHSCSGRKLDEGLGVQASPHKGPQQRAVHLCVEAHPVDHCHARPAESLD